jgi:hypothetical protein
MSVLQSTIPLELAALDETEVLVDVAVLVLVPDACDELPVPDDELAPPEPVDAAADSSEVFPPQATPREIPNKTRLIVRIRNLRDGRRAPQNQRRNVSRRRRR